MEEKTLEEKVNDEKIKYTSDQFIKEYEVKEELKPYIEKIYKVVTYGSDKQCNLINHKAWQVSKYYIEDYIKKNKIKEIYNKTTDVGIYMRLDKK